MRAPIMSFLPFLATLALAGCAANHSPQGDATSLSALVVVEENGGRVSIIDISSGKLRYRMAVGSLPHEVEVSTDGRMAFVSNFGIRDYDRRVGTPGATVAVIDLQRGEHLGHFDLASVSSGPGALAAPHGVKLRPPTGRELFINAEVGDAMVVFDAASRAHLRSFPIPAATHNFLFSQGGEELWLMAAGAGIYRVNPDTGSMTARLRTPTPARGMTWMPSGDHLLVSGLGELYIVDAGSAAIEQRIGDLGVGQIIYSGVTPDGRLALAPAPFDSRVIVVELETGRVVRRIPTGKAPIRVIVDEAGERAYVANAEDDHVSVIDLADWSVSELGPVEGPNGLALVP